MQILRYIATPIFTSIILLVIVSGVHSQMKEDLAAKTPRTYLAPPEGSYAKKPSVPKQENSSNLYSLLDTKVEIVKLQAGNTQNLPPGYYASLTPPVPDTIMIYDGGEGDFFHTIEIPAGKEIISSSDSILLITDLNAFQLKWKGVEMRNEEEHRKQNSMITRSGFIPGQGFGKNRYRFTIKPGRFDIKRGAMITASVHCRKQDNNIGTILCSVSSIDYQKGTFTVETSNEVPEGEEINWIVITMPDMQQ